MLNTPLEGFGNNSTVIPLMIPGVLIMGIGPILSWQEESKFKIIKEIIPSLIITTIITFIFFYIYKSFNLLGFFGIIYSEALSIILLSGISKSYIAYIF